MKLQKDFYLRDDVVEVSKDLLGKHLLTKMNVKLTGGIITETEAYAGVTDRASHAYGNKRTKRTSVMYEEGGAAYVYLCYGIHSLFNIVTNKQEVPHAVLIRTIQPVEGVDTMLKRRGRQQVDKQLTGGPGTTSQALGIHYSHTGTSLLENTIWLEDRGTKIPRHTIQSSPRIGVDYAGEDALLPWRFTIDI